MLKLPDVTLIVVETVAHDLARMAVEDCLRVAEFGDVIIYSDDEQKINVPGACHFTVEDWPTKEGCGQFCTFEAAEPVSTSHILFMEWDGWILRPEMWSNEFLAYDYVGAPWWYTDGLNVGNGGFSLRSKRLADFLAEHRDRFPAITDDLLCRRYRREIETSGGFKWAPEQLAHRFSFECSAPHAAFGFHAMRNWVHVLDRQALIERAKVAVQYPYVRGPSHLGQLLNAAPWLRQEIGI